MLGTEEDFRTLCREAHRRGMKVMLDGVFNHTGNNSLYFNALGFYPTLGRPRARRAPTIPGTTSTTGGPVRLLVGHPHPAGGKRGDPTYVDYIIEGPGLHRPPVAAAGADAWRLDVADELPDWFIEKIRAAMDKEKPGSFLLGEVWGGRQQQDRLLPAAALPPGPRDHGLMNYPFRVAALAYLQGGPARDFVEAMETIRENYPPAAFHSAMNMLAPTTTPHPHHAGAARRYPWRPGSSGPITTWAMEERGRGCRRLMTGALLLYGSSPAPP